MLKSLIDVDIRKVTAVLGIFIAIALPIAGGQVSLAYVFPDAWIPYVKADLGFAAFIASTILGSQGVATLVSPRQVPPPAK